MKNKLKRCDGVAALVFVLLSTALISVFFINQTFFEWAFARHQNPLSWYIRPLFILPLCWFAYKRSLDGIAATVFLLLSSMFWFPEPATADGRITEFLAFEKAWLTEAWDFPKILLTLLIPLSLGALCAAFWYRKVKYGIAVVILTALVKILWSVAYGGEAGKSVIIPAVFGMLVCVLAIGVVGMLKKKG